MKTTPWIFREDCVWPTPLKSVEGLPHAEDLSVLRVGPQVVRPEGPVVQLDVRQVVAQVLHPDDLPPDVDEVVHPAGVDGVDGVGVARVAALPDGDADALVDVPVPDPPELVDDPHCGSLVHHLRDRRHVQKTL